MIEASTLVRELAGPVVGWRVWTVRETSEGLRLGSVLHEVVWNPDRPAVAACDLDAAPHPVPGAACGCGFHAVQDPVDALSYLIGRDDSDTVCRVFGEVALWGHVLETSSGWRASHARPLRLYVAEQELVARLSAYGVSISSVECAPHSSRTCTGTPSRSAPRSRTSSATTST